MLPERKNFVLFDFDGVIADSFKTAFEVHKSVFPDMTEDDYRQITERNVNDWNWRARLEKAGHSGSYDFFEHYLPRAEKEVKIFEGMEEVIKKLHQEYELFIVSSNLTRAIKDFMQKHGLISCFMKIMGNDVHVSKVEKIRMVFSEYGTGPMHCVFVTDTLGDAREAQQLNVGSIGVAWGFNKPERLEAGNVFKIVEYPTDIQPAIREYFQSILT